MRKTFCGVETKLMSAVEQARGWAGEMVRREMRGSSDTAGAMRRLAHRYGIPRSVFHTLRYRSPKDIGASVYLKLLAAYEAECERQRKMLEHELEITRQIAGPHCASVRAAEALVGADNHHESVAVDALIDREGA